MKPGIHPNYGTTVIRCACGNVIETRGTRREIAVDICSSCHPFFTGKQKLVDTAGRIDRFQKKYGGKVAVRKKPEKPRPAPPPASPKLQPGEKISGVKGGPLPGPDSPAGGQPASAPGGKA